MRILAIAGAVLLGALLIFVGAFGARWLAPESHDASAPVTLNEEQTATTSPATQPKNRLDIAGLRELLAVLDPERRKQIIESEENFKKFVEQETMNLAVLSAAYDNGAQNNQAIKVLMERAGQRVLAEAYLNEVVRLNLDPDFPTDEQVREAFDKNPAVFKVPERVHLWQIFLEISDSNDSEHSKAQWQLAEKIAADLKAGKASFADLAKQHSAHEASRVNDGYMGLIKLNELLPPIAEAAKKLKQDGISQPVATESGLHIIKRGQILAAEALDFAAVQTRIRQRLKQEATIKVRQAAVQKIAEEYPVAKPSSDLESWRQSLLNPTSTTAADDGA